MKWWLQVILLILYAFWKDFKPGEPFLFKYHVIFLNLTEQQLNGEVYFALFNLSRKTSKINHKINFSIKCFATITTISHYDLCQPKLILSNMN